MSKKTNRGRLISGIFLIAGTMMGAGMLGMPLMTAVAGFCPAVIATTLVWFLMYCTGMLFLEVTLWMPDGSHVLSMSRRFLGQWGSWISGGVFIFLYYCLMMAYFAAGAPLLVEFLEHFLPIRPFLSDWNLFAFFACVFGIVVVIGSKSINRVNIILSIAMGGAWLILIASGAKEVDPIRLNWSCWQAVGFPMPVLFGAFGFHNVIPSLATYLRRDRKALRLAIFWGSFLPLCVYVIWQWLVIGVIPKAILEKTFLEKESVTVAFQTVTGRPVFSMVGKYFAFFAIVTSTLGVAFSMVDFLGDCLNVARREGKNRLGLTCLTFFPPCVFVALYPKMFTLVLGIAGGFGEAFLNGLLPIILVWVGRYTCKLRVDLFWLEHKTVLVFLALFTLYVVSVEIAFLIC